MTGCTVARLIGGIVRRTPPELRFGEQFGSEASDAVSRDSGMGGAPVKVPEIIAAARAAGVTLSIDDDSLLLRSSRPAPQEVVEALSRHKSEVIDHLQSDRGWTAEDWHVFFKDRAAIAEFDGGLPRQEAEAHAFGACVVEWLNRNPVRSAPDRCWWCGGGARRKRAPTVWDRARRSCLDAQSLFAAVARASASSCDRLSPGARDCCFE